jgi:Platelet-activating factor acetylhydrolase, isoform II
MKGINKNVVAICLLSLAVCATILSTSGRGRIQVSDFKVELPAPMGKHAVGRASFHWVDSSRAEEMTDDPNDRRELMVTLWYPAVSMSGETAPYFDNLDKLAGAIDQVHANVIRAVRGRAITGARLSSAQRRYPALIFSPGNEMNVAFYAAQIEDLASHGYVVLGIDHPYESLCVRYPDGRIARYSEEKRPKQGAPNFQEEFTRFYRQRVDWRAADATFVLNQLEMLNDGKIASKLSGRLDLKRVGAFGHSIGGVAAAKFCQSDRRFKACLNLDGKVNSLPFFTTSDKPDSESKGPDQPFMSFEKALPEPTEKQLAEWKTTREQVERARMRTRDREAELLKTVKSGGYRVTLRGATHQSFSDEPLILPFGEKEPHRRRTQIIRAYTLAFFEQFLRNRSANLFKDNSNDYPEVIIERFGPTPPN